MDSRLRRAYNEILANAEAGRGLKVLDEWSESDGEQWQLVQAGSESPLFRMRNSAEDTWTWKYLPEPVVNRFIMRKEKTRCR